MATKKNEVTEDITAALEDTPGSKPKRGRPKKKESVSQGKETAAREDTRKLQPYTGSEFDENGYRKTHRYKASKEKGMAKPGSMRGVKATDEDLQKFNSINAELFALQDIDLSNVEQVRNRIQWYFDLHAKYGVRPTVSGLGMALNGMSRTYLWGVVNDKPIGSNGYKSKLAPATVDEIKKAYKNMEIMWELLFTSGKLNPVTGIFMAKNNYGYKDQTEHVLTPTMNSTEEMTVEDIKARYAIDTEEK